MTVRSREGYDNTAEETIFMNSSVSLYPVVNKYIFAWEHFFFCPFFNSLVKGRIELGRFLSIGLAFHYHITCVSSARTYCRDGGLFDQAA